MDINLESCKTIDWALALKLANDEADWAKRMLNTLADELPDTKTKLIEAAANANYEQVARVVHKLHGACCYCGVPKLKKITEQFKTTVKADDPSTLQSYVQQLVQEIDAVIGAVKADSFIE